MRHLLDEGDPGARDTRLQEMADTAAYQLDTDRPEGAFDRHPTHWPLVFPEVFEAGGFDAVIGNPPFLGGSKLTGAFGTAYREFLVRVVASGARGSADLLAYFLLVASRLLNQRGQTGLIGTNTMAQGDTREVGLDQVTAHGATIRSAVKSAKWPTRSVNLEYSILWSSRQALGVGVARLLDDRPVTLITTSLDAAETETGKPFRLAANVGITFQGSKVHGMGFILTAADAERLIDHAPRNREVIFPYINGEDLNSRPDCSASRWVIDFRDWPLERAEEYPDCLEIVGRLVRPERESNNRAAYRIHWWRHAEHRPGLYKAIQGMSRVLAISLTSKVVVPLRIPTGMVYDQELVVFVWDGSDQLALLCSDVHRAWVLALGSTLETRPRYIASNVFHTFPQPEMTAHLDVIGEVLDVHRRSLMLQRQQGLTTLYNQVHSSKVGDPEIARLREIHVEIDKAVAEAYGWAHINLGHGFHETAQGARFTISGSARREVLNRLLALNHQRYAEEEAGGVTAAKGRRAAGKEGGAIQAPLFGP